MEASKFKKWHYTTCEPLELIFKSGARWKNRWHVKSLAAGTNLVIDYVEHFGTGAGTG